MLLAIFSALVIPALIFVLVVSHYQAERSIRLHLDAELGRTKTDTNRALAEFFNPLVDVTSVLANVLSDEPDDVKAASFVGVMYRTVSNVKRVTSLTVALEDGYVANLERITADVRSRHPEYPSGAGWVLRNISQPKGRAVPLLREVFYSEYPTEISTVIPTHMPDFYETQAYQAAKGSSSVYIGEVTLGAATNLPLVSIAVPIRRGDSFLGAAIANVTVTDLSKFLSENKISDNSESVILDAAGHVVAASSLAAAAAESGPAATSMTTPFDLDGVARRAMAFDELESDGSRDSGMHSFTAELDKVEYSISDFPIKNNLGLKYRALSVTPLNDFVGELRRSSRNFTILVVLLILVEAVLIVRMSRRMSRRIKRLASFISKIRAMDFGDGEVALHNVKIREVAELNSGISLLQSALRSFSLYVPLGVVRHMVDDGKALKPGVERRELTILFCDLENFSTLAQSISAEELLNYTTAYFSAATEAITRQGGTVDKFIGDAVMAFWGAPQAVNDHAARACRAAVDIVKGVEQLNEAWLAEGKRALRVRVGINSASVLVGNIGSPDRLSYTALGDGVNVASRLEGKNKELGSTICISDSTYERAKDQIVAKPLKPVSVKGRVGEFMVYELLDVVAVTDEGRKVA